MFQSVGEIHIQIPVELHILGGGRSSRSAWHLEGLAGAMASFEDAFVSPELNRWLGGFLGAGAAGLRLQCMAFRASKSLAGGSDRMRLHCLRCLWRWERNSRHSERALAPREAREGPPGRPFVRALMAGDHLSVDVASPGDLALFGWHCPPRQAAVATIRAHRNSEQGEAVSSI